MHSHFSRSHFAERKAHYICAAENIVIRTT